MRDGELEVLLITSRSSGDWIVPKGMVDAGFSEARAAAQEADEEAGVRGLIQPLLGHVASYKGKLPVRIAIYPLEVRQELDSYLEKGLRRRRWFTAKAASEKVRDRDLAVLIKQLRGMCRL